MTKEEAHKILCRNILPCLIGEWREAISIATKALEAEPHWIPVTERLPDNSRNVLITSRGGVSMAWYNGSYFEKGANTHHRKMQAVTAWCELPEPFKGVTE